MRYYETLYMINPNLPEDAYGEIKTKFADLIEKNRGVVINVDDWGKKSLAYLVKKFDKGYYVLIQYCGEGDIVAEIERVLRLDERVLKYQTVKLSDHADPEALRASAEAEGIREPEESPTEDSEADQSEEEEGSEDVDQSARNDED